MRIAAAADLSHAFRDVAAAVEQETGSKIEVTYGSTGLLAKQIEEGAPFDVFAAADVSFVDQVVRAGACDGATKALYARGHLVLWAKDPAHLPDSITALADPRFAHVAIANPEHAPYGRAAREALVRAGVWASLQDRLVFGENVRQTLVYAQTGNADVALVALSLAVSSGGRYVAVDPNLHAPLDQALVLCQPRETGKEGAAGGERRATPDVAKRFVSFLGSPRGREIMRRYGFLLPGEAEPPRP